LDIKRVVVLGANGAMGSGASALFAARGFDVVMLARTSDKAQEGANQALKVVRSPAIAARLTCDDYDALERHCAQAELILEAVAEDMALKQDIFQRIEAARKADSIVATVSSGLSMEALTAQRSDDFARHFMGIHLFNPPHVIVGTEMIPCSRTDPELFRSVVALMEKRLGRVVVECRDLPAFAGNRVGFKVLNECAQLALEHGVERIDALVGPQTGRAMPPLATVDLVGFDVHRAIVDNVWANTRDEAHDTFALPAYMAALIDKGHLGRKTAAKGGFYQVSKKGGATETRVLDPRSQEYRATTALPDIPFVREMRALHHVGSYREALAVLLQARGSDADLARRVVLGYVSYALHRVGPSEVVDRPLGIDLIMAYGFNWAPPSALVDLMGADATRQALARAGLPVPPVLADLPTGQRLFKAPDISLGRFFGGG
jgi:3-hydroxyacyl-CoA dehydrogenase